MANTHKNVCRKQQMAGPGQVRGRTRHLAGLAGGLDAMLAMAKVAGQRFGPLDHKDGKRI